MRVRALLVGALVGLGAASPWKLHHHPHPHHPCKHIEAAKVPSDIGPGFDVGLLGPIPLLLGIRASQGHEVPARLAYQCLESIPLIKEDAVKLLRGLSAFWTFDSTLNWLEEPPAGYPLPAVKLLQGLKDLENAVRNGTMTSEYKLQRGVWELMLRSGESHLGDATPLLRVFNFHPLPGKDNVVALSVDGVSLPLQYYLQSDLQVAAQDPEVSVSPITVIDGLPVEKFLERQSREVLSADPDYRWNLVLGDAMFDAPRIMGLPTADDFDERLGGLTSISHANGSERADDRQAFTLFDFEGVKSGSDYYKKQISVPTDKQHDCDKAFLSQTPATSEVVPRTNYPTTPFTDPEGVIAGYFLGGDHRDTAVLSVRSFLLPPSDHATMARDLKANVSKFLSACERVGSKKLIIDVSHNGGGHVFAVSLLFHMLFPSLVPFQTQNFRASPGFDELGSVLSSRINASTSDRQRDIFDNSHYHSPNGSRMTWTEIFGPHYYLHDKFSTVFSFTAAESDDLSTNGSRQQPFDSQDMLILSNGICDSACASFVHLLKWQGKVKSLVIGGRPVPGPMQTVGGTRGDLVAKLPGILQAAFTATKLGGSSFQASLKDSPLRTLLDFGCYLMERIPLAAVNLLNSIDQDDPKMTPEQFTFQAADCRIFWTKEMLLSVTGYWKVAADVWKGGLTHCVAGSSGHPSSLSGNPKLYNGGKPENVTKEHIFGSDPVLANKTT